MVVMLYNDLASEVYSRGDDDQEAERDLRAALDEYRKLPPGTYVEQAVALSNLGALLICKGEYAEAEPFVLQGLELRRKILFVITRWVLACHTQIRTKSCQHADWMRFLQLQKARSERGQQLLAALAASAWCSIITT